MATESLRVTSVLPTTAERVYAAWLDSIEHSRMTGGQATVEPRVGGKHTAWDGYIEGEILVLEPGRRIVQSWRSTEFPQGHPSSHLEIVLEEVPGGCEVTLIHTEIPDGQGDQYEEGWASHYFVPMKKHFAPPPERPTVKKAMPSSSPPPGRPVEPRAKAPAKKVAPKAAKKPAKEAKKAVAKKAAKKTAPKARPAKKAAAKAKKAKKTKSKGSARKK
jgi:uncharacterized protein YndB with AHSA1/START domain